MQVTSSQTEVITGADRNKLLPTATADMTTDFLVKYFPSIVDYDFTALVETGFDRIADGKETWERMIGDFYKDFHPLIAKTDKVSRQEVSQARELGKDPKSGEPIYARYGRYGPMLQKGDTEDEDKKPAFAPLPTGATLDSVTLEQALEMLKLPRSVGTTEDGMPIKANIGRFGPYIEVDVPKSPSAKKGKLFVSIKPHDPRTITEAEARELYVAKLAKDAAKHIASFPGGLQILSGPYGPYVTDGKKNARIAKDQDPKKLTAVEAKAILAAAPDKKRRFRRRAGNSAPTTT